VSVTWAGHVARIGGKRNTYKDLVGKLEQKDHLEVLHVHEGVILHSI